MTDITKVLDEIEQHCITLDSSLRLVDIGGGKMKFEQYRRNSPAAVRELKFIAIARAADALTSYGGPVLGLEARWAELRAALDALAGGTDAEA